MSRIRVPRSTGIYIELTKNITGERTRPTGKRISPEQKEWERLSALLERWEGYESLENGIYLDSTGQTCFIKPTNYEQKRNTKHKKRIGRVENMEYNAEEDLFTCVQGRRLLLRRECTELQNGQLVSNAWYRCESCDGCPFYHGKDQCTDRNVLSHFGLPSEKAVDEAGTRAPPDPCVRENDSVANHN